MEHDFGGALASENAAVRSKADEAVAPQPFATEPPRLPSADQHPRCGDASENARVQSRADEALQQAPVADVLPKSVLEEHKWRGGASTQSTLSLTELPTLIDMWRGGVSTTSQSTLSCPMTDLQSSLFDAKWRRGISTTRVCFIKGEPPCSLLGEPLNRRLLAAHEERLALETGSDCIGLRLVNFKRAVRSMSKFDLSEIDAAIDALVPLVTERQ
jgi:hypothetical protein